MTPQEQIQGKIQELQVLEQNLQTFIAQKQAIQVELNETNNAVEELSKSPEETYKITAGIMLKASPEDLKKDLEEKNNLLDLRIKTMEKQESSLEEKSSKLKEEINAFMTSQAKEKK